MTRDILLPDNEAARLERLLRTGILDTPREPAFDALARTAADLMAADGAMITFIDESRQWVKASCGVEVADLPRHSAICNAMVASGGSLLVGDMLADDRLRSHPLVAGEPRLRFYAGAPILVDEGLAIGAVCAFGRSPRVFGEDDVARIERVAALTSRAVLQHEAEAALIRLSTDLARTSMQVERHAERLAVSNRILARATRLAAMGAWEFNLSTGEIAWSDEMYTIHEVDRDFPLSDLNLLSFYPGPERTTLRSLIDRSRAEHIPYSFETRMTTGKGRLRQVLVTADVEFANGVPIRRFGFTRDITAERAREIEIARLADTDSLTGLANRHVFNVALARTLEKDGTDTALLLIDLDGFQEVNDTLGHRAGDQLLRKFARRLRRVAGKDGRVLARVGGDKFAVLCAGTGQDAACRLAAKAVKSLGEPMRWCGNAVQPSVSVGVAVARGHGSDSSETLMSDAELALRSAKATGRGRHAMFKEAMRAEAQRRFEVLVETSRALANGDMSLHFQPKVRLRDQKIVGFEALLRQRLPDGRLVSPDAFRAAMEDPDLSVRIGDFVIRQALDQAQQWTGQGLAFGSIAINLGPAQFRDPELASTLTREMAKRNLPVDAIEVEVTEGVLLSRASGNVLAICRALKEAGVKVAFDDFGTGFASLTHLREFPVDIIKIDRSFVSRICSDPATSAIVTAISGLARQLDLDLVAEGIETEFEAKLLGAMGCEYAQGYLFSRPLPPTAAADLLSGGSDIRRFA